MYCTLTVVTFGYGDFSSCWLWTVSFVSIFLYIIRCFSSFISLSLIAHQRVLEQSGSVARWPLIAQVSATALTKFLELHSLAASGSAAAAAASATDAQPAHPEPSGNTQRK